ncbi:MAG: AAA family ATPase, partial [Proteobacteria bacterium]|nr:AAA family ATPase [Pseudomonadota bacterium]
MNLYTAFNLDTLFGQQFFSNLDYFFAQSMANAFNEKDPIILVSCALVSKSLFEGHICIDIHEMSGTVRTVSETNKNRVRFPGFKLWITSLQASSMVSDTLDTPLVLDGDHRLYFSKYYDYQNRLTRNIAQRIFLNPFNVNTALMDELIEAFFNSSDPYINPQKNAVKNAVLNHFTIISGGPGTGKTYVTTVIKKILTLYANKHKFIEPKIICVAPT